MPRVVATALVGRFVARARPWCCSLLCKNGRAFPAVCVSWDERSGRAWLLFGRLTSDLRSSSGWSG